MAAACGADALVPKKFGCVSGSRALSAAKNVVLPPSAAATCGVRRSCVFSYRLPSESKDTGVTPPWEVKTSGR